MRFKTIIIIAVMGLVVLFTYVLLINSLAVAVYNQAGETETENTGEGSGAMVNLNIADNVDVSVERHRWYGTIYESHSKEKSIGTLRLFGLLKLPTMVNGKKWWIFHYLALGIYIFMIAITIVIDMVFKEKRRDENGALEH